MAGKATKLEELLNLNFEKFNDNEQGVTFELMNPADFEVCDQKTWDEVSYGACPKHIMIFNYHLITFTMKDLVHGPHLLGTCKGEDISGEYSTSEVKYMSPDKSAVVTRSGSLYYLGEASDEEEPTLSQCMFWCYTLRYWRLGILVKDWPEVFI